jgi:predicted kinase/DNA-binding XRE family transcriptional regulator
MRALAHVVFLVGRSGVGKSTVAQRLARALRAAHLDKDCLTKGAIAELLVALGSSPLDRESELYRIRCRPLEYQTMMSVVANIVPNGVSVIVDAPLSAELRDPTWYPEVTASLAIHGATPTVVLLTAPRAIAHQRIVDRGFARDAGKLADWDSYTAGIDADGPIVTPHLELCNDSGLSELYAKVDTLAARLGHAWSLQSLVNSATAWRIANDLNAATVARHLGVTPETVELIEAGCCDSLVTLQTYIDAVATLTDSVPVAI